MFYRWLNPLVKLSAHGRLKSIDILQLFKLHYPDYIQKPSFLSVKLPLCKNIFGNYRRQLFSTGLLLLFSDILFLAMPSALTPLLNILKELANTTEKSLLYGKGIIITFGLVTLTIADAALISAYFQRSYSLGLHIRSFLIQKVLHHNKGNVVNLATKDGMTVQNFIPYLHYSWSCPLQVILCSYSIYRIFGLAPTVAGLSVIIATTLLVTKTSKRLVHNRNAYSHKNDARCSFQSYWLDNFFQVRYAPLSFEFFSHVHKQRRDEIELLKCASIWRLVIRSLNTFSPILSFLACITWYNAFMKETISSVLLIKAVALFSMLRSPLQWIPALFTRSAECLASLKRLEACFVATDTRNLDRTINQVIKISRKEPYNFDVDIQGPKLVLVNGRRKELFIDSVLQSDEAPMHVHYCSVDPWIRKEKSIQDNIVLFNPLDQSHFSKVVQMAQLIDLDPSTLASELSQGQKKRMFLARAAYSPPLEVLFIEEPLAGLDFYNVQKIISELLVPLSKERLVILVSNDERLLSVSERIITFETDGCKQLENIPMNPIVESYPYEPLTNSPTKLNVKITKEFEEKGLKIPTNIYFLLFLGTAGVIGQQIFKTLFYKYTQADVFAGTTSPFWMTFFGLAHMLTFTSASYTLYRAFQSLGSHKHDLIVASLCSASYLAVKGKEGDLKNALSIDLEAVEYQLGEVYRSFAFQLITTGATLFTMLLAQRVLIIPISTLSIFLYFLVSYYRKALQASNQFVAQANTRLISLINDFQASSTFLNALNRPSATQALRLELDNHLEELNASVFYNYSLPGWLELRLSFVGATLIGCLACAAMWSPVAGIWASIALARSLTLTRSIHGIIRKLYELEPYRIHLQRLSQSIPESADRKNLLDSSVVEWKSVDLGYSEPLIKDFSICLPAGSKMLIQGPSGCGKSTLIRSLLEPELILRGTVHRPQHVALLTTSSVSSPVPGSILPVPINLEESAKEPVIQNLAHIYANIESFSLVLLDEITCNMEPSVAREIEAWILCWSCTVIYISHSPQLPPSQFSHHLQLPIIV